MKKHYPGIGILGHESITALYGVDNGIVDWQGTGIQHFFHKSFQYDLIHSATTYLQHSASNQIELGNRLISQQTHPIHQHPFASSVENGFCYTTTFRSQVNEHLSWAERAYATHHDQIVFETTFCNKSLKELSLVAGGYVILRNPQFQGLSYNGSVFTWQSDQTKLAVSGEKVEEIKFYKESPTGFVYRTLQQTFENKESDTLQDFTSETMIGVVTKRHIDIPANGEITVKWMISASSVTNLQKFDWNYLYSKAKGDWDTWVESGTLNLNQFPEPLQNVVKTNVIALKASLLDGFVPADLTGHYYSNGSPSYYVRDSLMIAKAFLMAGYNFEAKSIIQYAASRKTKGDSGEFYQRYNAVGEPSEGANNNVFHQLDSQGYFLYLIKSYFERTNEWIVPYEQVKKAANILFDCERKAGLIGPEGGVNEGVFGPAFITSTNMFLVGGLLYASQIASLHQDDDHETKWRNYANGITNHIEQDTWINEQKRYGYGYVLYADELVKKYDTPQYFGPLYGYPLTTNFKEMINASLENQGFFEYGIGYSEQEYHHGPWIFNTASNAQCQLLIGNYDHYVQMINWMLAHTNAYGLLPEAIDANNEDLCFINPLTWGSAEFISAVASGQHLLSKPGSGVKG